MPGSASRTSPRFRNFEIIKRKVNEDQEQWSSVKHIKVNINLPTIYYKKFLSQYFSNDNDKLIHKACKYTTSRHESCKYT